MLFLRRVCCTVWHVAKLRNQKRPTPPGQEYCLELVWLDVLLSPFMRSKLMSQTYYEKGNAKFHEGNFMAAIDLYSAGIISETDCETLEKLLLNRSQCFLINRDYENVVRDCSSAIKLNVESVKAYVRRAIAQEYLGEFAAALQDIEFVLYMDPPANLRHTAQAMMPRLRTLATRDHFVSAQEGRPNLLVTNHQTLRLVFMEPPPSVIALKTTFNVKLCIGNELGLWNRSLLAPLKGENEHNDTPVMVLCDLQVIPISDNDIEMYEKRENNVLVLLGAAEGRSSEAALPLQPVLLESNGKVSLDLAIALADSRENSSYLGPAMILLKFYLNRVLPSGMEVVPVLSLPMKVTITDVNIADKCNTAANVLIDNTLALCEQQHAYCIRDVSVADSRMFALESPGFLGIGGKVWDSTYVLLRYLSEQQEELIRGKRVLELGSGTGLAGISLCSMLPASVILTDMAEVVPLLAANVALNGVLVADPAVKQILRDRYSAQAHFWGTPIAFPSVSESGMAASADAGNGLRLCDCEVVIASDVVYDPGAYQPLIDTLFQLLVPRPARSNNSCDTHSNNSSSSSNISSNSSGSAGKGGELIYPVCILAHRHRHPEDQQFFDMLLANTDICTERIQFAGSAATDTCSTLSDVILFRIQHKIVNLNN